MVRAELLLLYLQDEFLSATVNWRHWGYGLLFYADGVFRFVLIRGDRQLNIPVNYIIVRRTISADNSITSIFVKKTSDQFTEASVGQILNGINVIYCTINAGRMEIEYYSRSTFFIL